MLVYLSPTRFYTVAIERDLFGDVVIHRCRGGRGSRRVGEATDLVPATDLRARMREIGKRRRAHGYRLA